MTRVLPLRCFALGVVVLGLVPTEASAQKASLAVELSAALKSGDEAFVARLTANRIVQTYPGTARMERRSAADLVALTKGCAISISRIPLAPGESADSTALVQADCPANPKKGISCSPRVEIEVTTRADTRLTRFVFWNGGNSGRCDRSAMLGQSRKLDNG